jgi:CHAT domain-containing protein
MSEPLRNLFLILLLLLVAGTLHAYPLVEEPSGLVCDEDSAMGADLERATRSLDAAQYQKALEIYFLWLPRIMEKRWLPLEARVRINLGLTFDSLGDPAQAAAELNRALQISVALSDLRGIGKALLNLGPTLRKLGRPELARQALEASLFVWWKLEDQVSLKLALANLAQVSTDLGDEEEAQRNIETALNLPGDPGQIACLPLVQACVSGQVGDLQSSIEEAARGSEWSAKVGDPEAFLLSQLLLANNLAMQGDLETAYKHVVKALEQVELQGDAVTVGELKAKLMDKHALAYAMAVTLSAELGRPAESFVYAEQARARALLDQFSRAHQGSAEDHRDLRSQVQTMEKVRAALLEQIREENRKTLAQQDEALLTRLEKEVDELQAEQANLRVVIEIMSPGLQSAGSSSIGIESVQAVLDRETTLVMYFVSQETIPGQKSRGIYAWVLRKEDLHLVPLITPSGEVARKIALLRQRLESREPERPLSAELYQELLAPLVPHIRGRRLILIPHGVLHQLPFTVLWNAEKKRYLVDEYVLSQAPSASVLVHLARRGTPAGGGILVLGDPDGSLPYAAKEVRAVAALHGVQPLIGSAATEDAVLHAGGYSILHLAAHGSYDSVHPFSSRIDLAPGGDHDGRLELQEMLDLKLDGTSLVVLSGCRTQAEEASEGDELAGFPRVLLLAGARSVVASLWRVDDRSTAFLMESFHRHLRKGRGVAEALREAQIDTRGRYSDPYDWAAFSVMGWW